jgi:hypothetical protein
VHPETRVETPNRGRSRFASDLAADRTNRVPDTIGVSQTLGRKLRIS